MTNPDGEGLDHVSPAYAGIDPRGSLGVRGTPGFPRIRGDRPETSTRCRRRSAFPPHTRGSTEGRKLPLDGMWVSPAYAGIDRRHLLDAAADRRFPRIRGDRPKAANSRSMACGFPPHTRGSTWCARFTPSDFVVSPAYAGIDLRLSVVCVTADRFPRIRGDRPRFTGCLLPKGSFPPHTRGSTVYALHGTMVVRVSPAYAGIDRLSPWPT